MVQELEVCCATGNLITASSTKPQDMVIGHKRSLSGDYAVAGLEKSYVTRSGAKATSCTSTALIIVRAQL